jgi:hypothetical protein
MEGTAFQQPGVGNRIAAALEPHWSRITSALEPRRIPDGIEAWKTRQPETPATQRVPDQCERGDAQ